MKKLINKFIIIITIISVIFANGKTYAGNGWTLETVMTYVVQGVQDEGFMIITKNGDIILRDDNATGWNSFGSLQTAADILANLGEDNNLTLTDEYTFDTSKQPHLSNTFKNENGGENFKDFTITQSYYDWLYKLSNAITDYINNYANNFSTSNQEALNNLNDSIKNALNDPDLKGDITEEQEEDMQESINENEEAVEDYQEDVLGDDHYDDEDDSDIGGILLEPIVWFINLIADAAQSLVTAFMRDDIGFRAILQGKRFATISANIAKKMEITEDSTDSKHIIWYIDDDGNKSYSETDTILLDVQGSKEQPSDWKGDTTMSADGIQAYYRKDGVVSGSDVEDYDGSLGGNEYFINASGYKNRYSYPLIAYSPEEIFAGDVDILNANFLSNNESSNTAFTTIRNIIKTWFRALRYLGLAGLLSVLIYTGIKIMTSSVSQDKAKYKERIVDWVIAMVIMFLLPYIMSFIFMISDKLIDLFNDDNVQQPITVYVYDPNAGNGNWTFISNLPGIGSVSDLLADRITDITGVSVQGHKYTYTKFTTNLMGLVRFQVQSRNVTKLLSYEIMYIMLIVFTIRFTIIYLKRMIYIAFLTMISPIVAMMYPIDKMGDGKSQSFEEWLKEYIFNALLQPLHMLLYYVFVSSAMSFATKNILYVLVVFGFMTQAEKILKEIFGFGKARMGTVGGLSGAAATAVTLSGITSVAKNVKQLIGSSNNSNASGNGGNIDSGNGSSSSDRVNFANYPGIASSQVTNETDRENLPDTSDMDRERMLNTQSADIHDYLDQSETGEVNPELTDEQKLAQTFSDYENMRLAKLIDGGMNPDDAINQIDEERRNRQPELTDEQKLAQTFSDDENMRLAELIDGGMNADDAVHQIAAERRRGQPELTDEQKLAQTFSDDENMRLAELVDGGMNPDDAVNKIAAERLKRLPQDPTQHQSQVQPQVKPQVQAGSATQPNSGTITETNVNLPQTNNNKYTAGMGTLDSLKAMVAKRGQNMRHAVSRITPKKVLKGFAKGVALGGAAVLGAGAVLGQAAISLAMDGTYNPLEGVATFAGATIGANKLLNKAGKGVSGLYQEYQQTSLGSEEYKKKKRRQEFLDNPDNFKRYQQKYGSMGYAKVSTEYARGARLAEKGITDANEQMQVAAYTDSMVEETFNEKYKGRSAEEIHKDAEKIRENARRNGDTNMEKLSDRDTIKVSMRNAIAKDSTMSIEDIAVNTQKARKEIGESVVNSSKDKQEAWIEANSAGDKQAADGMRWAIESSKRMNLAQQTEKGRQEALKQDYAQYSVQKKAIKSAEKAGEIEQTRIQAQKATTTALAARQLAEKTYREAGRDRAISKQDREYQKEQARVEFEKARKEADTALNKQMEAMEKEAKTKFEAGKLSSDEDVRDWQIALTALDVAKKDGGKLDKNKFKQELSDRYSGQLGTDINGVVKNAITTLEDAGVITKTAKNVTNVNASATAATNKLNRFKKKDLKTKALNNI